jgi:hypothetical protein
LKKVKGVKGPYFPNFLLKAGALSESKVPPLLKVLPSSDAFSKLNLEQLLKTVGISDLRE